MPSHHLIYGFHALRSRLSKAPQSIQEVFLLERRKDKRSQQLLAQISGRGIPVQQLDDASFASAVKQFELSEAVHQGVFARIHQDAAITSLEQLWPSLPADALILVLDGVSDPHNLGACLRVADATAVTAVIAPRHGSAPLSATALKAASGGADSLPYITVTNLANSIAELQEQGFTTYATADDAPLSLYHADFKGRIALVLGSEGDGVRTLTRQNCDHRLAIPMLGEVESLNVSVAAALCLYEVRRQQGALG